mmetsp:Transcript_5616/g.21130  ORF Transcript_5616/g.21130 Transcript_5616/m.21130 type:complete len:131 (+) Transcript_5616:434-826(+)
MPLPSNALSPMHWMLQNGCNTSVITTRLVQVFTVVAPSKRNACVSDSFCGTNNMHNINIVYQMKNYSFHTTQCSECCRVDKAWISFDTTTLCMFTIHNHLSIISIDRLYNSSTASLLSDNACLFSTTQSE